MSDLDGELQRLARLAGVERGFTDYRGRRHELSPPELGRLLATLGHDTSDAETVRAAADVLENAAWTRVLPPVVTLQEGAPAHVLPVMIAPVLPEISWELACEDGTRIAAHVSPEALPLEAEREIGGLWYQRRRLDLPVLAAGYHRLALRRGDGRPLGETLLIVAPPACHFPPWLAGDRRCWGLAVQLYGLRSARNWGIGDFTDLAGIAAAAAELGADLLGVNPLHALFPTAPERCSPYSPSSRVFLNPLYIDPGALPEFFYSGLQERARAPGFRRRLAALRAGSHVDYAGVAECKLGVLRELHAWFREHAEPERRAAYAAFCTDQGATLDRFAEEQCALEHRPASDEHDWHCWLQWLAREQLDNAAEAARTAGMRIGLYLDLAVGPAADGAEVRAAQDLFATEASVGAPPDPLAPQGQDWGIPPFHPRRLREQGYAPFIRLLRANMPQGGALRIDHVMLLMRLWWIPAGSPSSAGGYVHYQLDELMSIVALESKRRRCLVIGEDLGTVPGEVRAAMERHGVLSYRVLMFEREPDGSFRPPAAYPRHSLVTPTTHDLPTLAGYWQGTDLDLRTSLGLWPDPGDATEARAERAEARAALVGALRAENLAGEGAADPGAVATGDFAMAAQLYAARSTAAVLMLQPEDWIGETQPVNVPGTHDSYPNWRRKLATPWPELLASGAARALASKINRARAGAEPAPENDK
jgi:(1->4)-alpha-D-glucan 1-alpha-D-glucosylmutase